jgi:glyoxylase-like metal-dependent hydrolase (beta-lactamase superfamily II)
MKKNPFSLNFWREPGEVEQLEANIQRIIAPNASPMTFTGTNTYLVGNEQLAVIDPGPKDFLHLNSILSAVKSHQKITHILITHSHIDHSPLSKLLKEKTGAQIYAFGNSFSGKSPTMKRLTDQGDLGGGEGLDLEFEPDISIKDNDHISSSEWSFEVIHTPGHLGNHLCFGLNEQNILFSADHVMGWATSLVSPPDGDLTQFMESLQKLLTKDQYIKFFPGHGDIISNPREIINYIIDHRKMRECQILDELKDSSLTATKLAKAIYTDVDQSLIPAAARNVFAHLIDLGERDLVTKPKKLNFSSKFEKIL